MDYKKRFGLKEAPFRLSPDPGFFFPSQTHREALETLVYAIRSGEGFIQITGSPGTGKSVTIRKILKDLGDSVVVGLILHSNIRAKALLHAVMQDLKIDLTGITSPSRETLMPVFQEFLLDQAGRGKQVVVIVDEAQNLPDNTLEELRMLSNLETEKEKLLQIILVGQVELEDKISDTRLSQLAQRITLRYRLSPLNLKETTAYIFHRLEIAARNPDELQVGFKACVIKAIHKQTRGIPRLINIVCERALMAAFVDNRTIVTLPHLDKALASIRGEGAARSRQWGLKPLAYAVFALFFCTAALWGYVRMTPGAPALKKIMARVYDASLNTSPSIAKPSPVVELQVPPKPSAQTAPPPARALPPDARTPAPQTPAQVPASRPGTDTQVPEKPVAQFNPGLWIEMSGDGARAGVVSIQARRLAILEKKNNALVETQRISLDWPYPQGIYMAGVKNKDELFIFHPEVSCLEDITLDNPEFWEIVMQEGFARILPLVVLDDFQSNTEPPRIGPQTVLSAVKSWVADWQAMDLDKTMDHMANAVNIYSPGMAQHLVFSKSRMRAIKADIFKHSGSIRVDLSGPVCLINPLNPAQGFAVFHQAYQSRSYEDSGVKVLYFKRLVSSVGASFWKISGRLWLMDGRIEQTP